MNYRAVLKEPIDSSEFEDRNRALFKTDGKRIGFVSEDTNILASVDDCLILNLILRKLFHDIKEQLPHEVNFKMREWVRQQFENLPSHFPVIDLFCGSANFTEVLS